MAQFVVRQTSYIVENCAMKCCSAMSELSRQFTEPLDRRVGTRLRQPNRTLDLEGINRERLRTKKAQDRDMQPLLPLN